MTSLDLAVPIRDAIASSVDDLGQYLNVDAVFTRSPVPPETEFPFILVSPDVSSIDRGGLSDQHVFVRRNVFVYGRNDTPAQYRLVESIAYAVRDLFHRDKKSITVTGWSVIQVWAEGPTMAPTDDDETVGRMVSLMIELSAR